MNPVPVSDGLKLLISETDNSLDLALDVAEFFRLNRKAAGVILDQVVASVRSWRSVARSIGAPRWDIEEWQMRSGWPAPASAKATEPLDRHACREASRPVRTKDRMARVLIEVSKIHGPSEAV
jgi:hypothetical protein